MRVVPENNYSSKVASTTLEEAAAHAPGLKDALRNQEGPTNLASKVNHRHPLEQRTQNWEKTQFETRLEIYRRIFGAGEPIKRNMELNMVDAADSRPQVLGGSSHLHRDILLNKDADVDWEDVYSGGFEQGESVPDFHTEMERKMGI